MPRDPIVRAVTDPDAYAEITACARSRTPRLAGTPPTWDFTISAPTADSRQPAARAISRRRRCGR
ncbi:hypothetical protein [Streptomyces sp. NPDC050988]|uniref:hypothetical protein n=1 Tax=Streptomyces sp. NPDC050988 TaxID=3365637 RepID=UPI0037975977